MYSHQESVDMQIIATIRSCYPQRFGIPRQSGLVKSATAVIEFANHHDNTLALRDIETFSHLWVVFLFHQQHYSTFKPLVQPPRLGGKKNVGVYATRSPNRINPIGLSAVLLQRVEQTKNTINLHVQGGDFLDGTPVLDLKPYVPFADSIATATTEWADPIEAPLTVTWSSDAAHSLALAAPADAAQLKQLIDETVAQDPRPAYERNKDGKPGQTWGARVKHVDIKWQVQAGIAEIVALVVV